MRLFAVWTITETQGVLLSQIGAMAETREDSTSTVSTLMAERIPQPQLALLGQHGQYFILSVYNIVFWSHSTKWPRLFSKHFFPVPMANTSRSTTSRGWMILFNGFRVVGG